MRNHSKEKKRGSLATKIIMVVCATVWLEGLHAGKDNDDGSGREQR